MKLDQPSTSSSSGGAIDTAVAYIGFGIAGDNFYNTWQDALDGGFLNFEFAAGVHAGVDLSGLAGGEVLTVRGPGYADCSTGAIDLYLSVTIQDVGVQSVTLGAIGGTNVAGPSETFELLNCRGSTVNVTPSGMIDGNTLNIKGECYFTTLTADDGDGGGAAGTISIDGPTEIVTSITATGNSESTCSFSGGCIIPMPSTTGTPAFRDCVVGGYHFGDDVIYAYAADQSVGTGSTVNLINTITIPAAFVRPDVRIEYNIIATLNNTAAGTIQPIAKIGGTTVINDTTASLGSGTQERPYEINGSIMFNNFSGGNCDARVAIKPIMGGPTSATTGVGDLNVAQCQFDQFMHGSTTIAVGATSFFLSITTSANWAFTVHHVLVHKTAQ